MDLPTSYVPSYFSINDILASQQRVQCEFQKLVRKMGYLDTSCEHQDLPKGTKLELPLWLANGVAAGGEQNITVEVPKAYKEGYRKILDADANVVDLHKLGPYFYEFGAYLLDFHPSDGPEICTMLTQTYKSRFRCLMDSAQNASHQDISRLTSTMDSLELELFESGLKSANELRRWRGRKSGFLMAADMVVAYNKRKESSMADDNTQHSQQ